MTVGYERSIVGDILHRLEAGPRLVQVVTGPRQVGKTTAARQIEKRWSGPVEYASADISPPPGPEWIRSHWVQARRRGHALLVLDEVQKVAGWAEEVKSQWDEDRRAGVELDVLVLGSSVLLLAKGTAESLAGRFFLHRCSHWTLRECREAFGWDLDTWLFFGGYPGAVPLVGEESAWKSYVADSLVEVVLARDVMSMESIQKPALMRNLFILSSRFPARVLSYNKILGQLQDAGNTTTLAHYLEILAKAFLVSGLGRFSRGQARSRGSSPKLVLWNNALVNALGSSTFEQARSDHSWWGRLVENAVGAHLVSGLRSLPYEVTYWRKQDEEVDYVVQTSSTLWAIEVKSGRERGASGLASFLRVYPDARPLIVGSGGMDLEEFLAHEPRSLLT